MKRKRLRPFVIPVLSISFFTVLITAIVTFNNSEVKDNFEELSFVNGSIVDYYYPVLNELEDNNVIARPYQTDVIDIYRKFYDGIENKENAIIFLDGSYIQNSGIIYNSSKEFEVVSILDGEVIELRKDELLGYVIVIKHNNGLISYYEGLSMVNVRENDKVTKNTIIGKSGELNLDVNIKEALLFELTKDGKYVNPESYYDKNINEL